MNNSAAAYQDRHAQDVFHTDLPVGEILRRTRVYYNQSLMEVEAALRIRSNQLQAIEEGDFNQMPGRVYAIGFVRSYSEYLGLDGDKMVALFKAQYAAFQKRPDLNFPVAMTGGRLPHPYVILGSLLAAILFIAFWSGVMLPRHTRESIPEVPEELKQTSLTMIGEPSSGQERGAGGDALAARKDVPSQGGVDALTEEAQAVMSDKVELVVSENAWTEIKDSQGNIILRRILKAGDKYVVPDGEAGKGLVMSTGNAGGITVFIGGKKLGALGKPAKVRRNVPLDAAALRQYFK